MNALTPWWRATTLPQRVGLALGPLSCLALALIPSPLHDIEGIGAPALAAGVAVWMALWWFTEAVPMALTACLPLVLFPALGVFGRGLAADAGRAAAPFISAYIFLFLGGMTLGAAMEERGLHRRVALHIMRAIGTQPKRLLLGMLLATATVSMWISNTATAVMMLPIAIALLKELELGKGGGRLARFGTGLMLAVAYGASIGGIGTKIGSPTNSLLAGYLADKLDYQLGFLLYMAAALPFVALFLPIVWWILWREGRHDAPEGHHGSQVLVAALKELGPMSRHERVVAAVFTLAALAWIFGGPLTALVAPWVPKPWEGFRFSGRHYEASVAILAALVLLVTGTVTWKGIRGIPWSTLLLLGGSFAMAEGIEGSGLSQWLGLQLAAVASLPFFLQLLLTTLATVLLSAVASNTATISLMLNVLPQSITLLTVSTFAASCDFALPAGTPPNAIVFGSGYVRVAKMMRIGSVLDLLAAVILAVYGWIYVRALLPS